MTSIDITLTVDDNSLAAFDGDPYQAFIEIDELHRFGCPQIDGGRGLCFERIRQLALIWQTAK